MSTYKLCFLWRIENIIPDYHQILLTSPLTQWKSRCKILDLVWVKCRGWPRVGTEDILHSLSNRYLLRMYWGYNYLENNLWAPDQMPTLPDRVPNCLQRLSADVKLPRAEKEIKGVSRETFSFFLHEETYTTTSL